ncbi:MAG: hypothetical protein ACOC8H_00840 [bacterium]
MTLNSDSAGQTGPKMTVHDAFLDWLQEVTHAIKADRLWAWRREIADLDDQEVYHLKGLVTRSVITTGEVNPRSFQLTHLVRLVRHVRFPRGRPELPGDADCLYCRGSGLMRVLSSYVFAQGGAACYPWEAVPDKTRPEGCQVYLSAGVVHCPCAWPGDRRPRIGRTATTEDREGWQLWYRGNLEGHNRFFADIMTIVDLLETAGLYQERMYWLWARRVYRVRRKPLPEWLREPDRPKAVTSAKRRPPPSRSRRAPPPKPTAPRSTQSTEKGGRSTP